MTELLMQAGADVAAKTSTSAPMAGSAPINGAAGGGHSEVVRVLIEAGANSNSHRLNGATPLYSAGQRGHVGTIKCSFVQEGIRC